MGFYMPLLDPEQPQQVHPRSGVRSWPEFYPDFESFHDVDLGGAAGSDGRGSVADADPPGTAPECIPASL